MNSIQCQKELNLYNSVVNGQSCVTFGLFKKVPGAKFGQFAAGTEQPDKGIPRTAHVSPSLTGSQFVEFEELL